MKYQLLIKLNYLKNEDFSCVVHSDVVFVLQINVKMSALKQVKFHAQLEHEHFL